MLALFLSPFLCGLAFGQSPPPAEDARQIILRSAALDQRDSDAQKNYTYIMRTEQRRLDSSGKVTSVESEVHEVLVLYGRPYRRLIAKDDKPLPPDEERKEQRKLDEELERRRKASERDKDHEKLARRDSKAQEERKAMGREIADAFTFKILGEEKVSGRDAWVIQAEPLPGYRPRSSRAKMLPNFRGKLWVTKDEYRWVKLQAEVIRPVSFGWVLARLQPGSQLFFEQKHVHEDIWLPSSVHMKLFARVALLKKVNAEVDVVYSNYRKFQSDSQIVQTSQVPTAP